MQSAKMKIKCRPSARQQKCPARLIHKRLQFVDNKKKSFLFFIFAFFEFDCNLCEWTVGGNECRQQYLNIHLSMWQPDREWKTIRYSSSYAWFWCINFFTHKKLACLCCRGLLHEQREKFSFFGFPFSLLLTQKIYFVEKQIYKRWGVEFIAMGSLVLNISLVALSARWIMK